LVVEVEVDLVEVEVDLVEVEVNLVKVEVDLVEVEVAVVEVGPAVEVDAEAEVEAEAEVVVFEEEGEDEDAKGEEVVDHVDSSSTVGSGLTSELVAALVDGLAVIVVVGEEDDRSSLEGGAMDDRVWLELAELRPGRTELMFETAVVSPLGCAV
jgi:hypothetical protein